jgi:hypothetical protein
MPDCLSDNDGNKYRPHKKEGWAEVHEHTLIEGMA